MLLISVQFAYRECIWLDMRVLCVKLALMDVLLVRAVPDVQLVLQGSLFKRKQSLIPFKYVCHVHLLVQNVLEILTFAQFAQMDLQKLDGNVLLQLLSLFTLAYWQILQPSTTTIIRSFPN